MTHTIPNQDSVLPLSLTSDSPGQLPLKLTNPSPFSPPKSLWQTLSFSNPFRRKKTTPIRPCSTSEIALLQCIMKEPNAKMAPRNILERVQMIGDGYFSSEEKNEFIAFVQEIYALYPTVKNAEEMQTYLSSVEFIETILTKIEKTDRKSFINQVRQILQTRPNINEMGLQYVMEVLAELSPSQREAAVQKLCELTSSELRCSTSQHEEGIMVGFLIREIDLILNQHANAASLIFPKVKNAESLEKQLEVLRQILAPKAPN